MQPRVVSKKAKAPEPVSNRLISLRAPRFTGGIGAVNPAAVRGAKGFIELNPAVAVARVETIVPKGIARQSNQIGVKFDVVDGGVALRKDAIGAGGVLTLTGAFRPRKIGRKGIVLRGKVSGYVNGSTGRFADAELAAGTPFTGRLGRDGRRWRLTWPKVKI